MQYLAWGLLALLQLALVRYLKAAMWRKYMIIHVALGLTIFLITVIFAFWALMYAGWALWWGGVAASGHLVCGLAVLATVLFLVTAGLTTRFSL